MQEVETTVTSGKLTIVVEFIVNSPAKGYFTIIKHNSSSLSQMMAVLNKSAPAVLTGLEPNTYDVLVYDMKETGLPNDKPAVEIEDIIVSQGN